jgi:hypothetical protein
MSFLEHDAVDDLRAAASIDLGYLADEVVDLGELAADPDYVQSVAFYEAARDALDAAERPEDFVAVCRALGSGRYGMALARARRDSTREPPTAQPCFFDPGHGTARQLIAWTPPDLDPRTVPVCAVDAELVAAGEQPEPRRVRVGEGTAAFWSAPEHFSNWFQGYFGNGEACYPVRMLDGFPLGRCFVEPVRQRDVVTADEIFRRYPTRG